MAVNMDRRALLSAGIAAGAAALGGGFGEAQAAPARRSKSEPFGYCLNTSTLSGQKRPFTEVIDIAAKAGYQALEPWIRDFEDHVKAGGTLADLKKRIADRGLTVESAIGFAPWIVDDADARKKGLEQAKREMDMVLQVGGTRIAAPPVGATDRTDMDPLVIADRYRALLELGDQVGVVPQLEVWGFSKTLNRLGTAATVAIESAHPKACILADIYHLYKGGSGYNGLKLLAGSSMHVLHVNDYPANPPRETINDAQRVYPGDGIAPLDTIFRDLDAMGYRGYLSLELFNREYWKQDAFLVAKTGLDKTRAAVKRALKG
jgi:sugar phosphate isomerase/epimerase